ncbi:hypothetical protein IW262DRAFT_1418887 [Armillaria fumosa]|nr:hypothetical protein IW262DRAFT_1418887 [Armillaria fumosa]
MAAAPLLENCPTCGIPGRLNLKDDNKQVLDVLRAEQPLLEYNHDWVHQNIATLDGHLLSLRQSLSRLESLTALIQTQIDSTSTAKHQFESISAPIRRLPRDILLEIFSLSFSRGARDYPWTLGHVCHWWRDIVHSSPMLWSVVVLVPPYNPDIIETQLQRSGNVPLSVYISIESYGGRVHSSTIIDRVMGLCHRWSKLELHAHGSMPRQMPSFLPQLRTLKVRGSWSSEVVPVLNAPLLKTVRSDDFSRQLVPYHITHLALSRPSIEGLLPALPLFSNLIELRDFTPKYFAQSVAPGTSPITHPTLRFLSVSGISILSFLTLPALECFQYSLDTTEDSSVVSAFLSRSRCTLKTLLAGCMPNTTSFLELLGSQRSLCRLSLSLRGDRHHVICQELSSPGFLPNLEHLTIAWINEEFCIVAKMIRARWYAPSRRIQTFVVVRNALEPKNMDMGDIQVMKDEGLDFRVVEGQIEREVWLDPLMMESEDVL